MAFFGKRNAQDWLEELMGTIVIEEKTNAQQAKIRELAFYTAVGLIADMVSGCEVQVLEGGKPVKNANWYTFNVSANPNQSGRELLCDWIVNYYYSGTGLMVPLTGNLYVADSFSVEELPLKGDVYSGISINGYQIKRTFKADNHTRRCRWPPRWCRSTRAGQRPLSGPLRFGQALLSSSSRTSVRYR
ncbi:MAG: phage portal protein [Clostridiales bacterium]|nr:phage portal protein [Clostridiales bacterium]